MKKYIFLPLALLSLLFSLGSCSSDENIPEPQQSTAKQAVSINIASINREFNTVDNAPTVRATTTDSCYLWYTIHRKADGSFVKQQKINKSDVLAINDSLPQGDYIYSIFACAANYLYINSDTYSNSVLLINGGEKDIFYKSVNITVGNSALNLPITLERLTGKVIVNIEDPELIPANVEQIKIKGNYLPDHFYMSTGLMDYNKSTEVPDFVGISQNQLLAAQGNQLEVHLLPNASDFYKGDKQLDLSINLITTNKQTGMPEVLNSILIKKNVIVKQNEQLRLTGKLFPSKNNGSSISLDTEWKATIVDSFDNN